MAVGCVGLVVTARYGDAPPSPPCPQPKSLAAAPLVILRQALKRQRVDSGLWPGSRKGNEFLNETVRGEVEPAPEINFAGGTIDHVDLG